MDISKAEKNIATLTKQLSKVGAEADQLKKQMSGIDKVKIGDGSLQKFVASIGKADAQTKELIKTLTTLDKRKASNKIFKDNKDDIESAEAGLGFNKRMNPRGAAKFDEGVKSWDYMKEVNAKYSELQEAFKNGSGPEKITALKEEYEELLQISRELKKVESAYGNLVAVKREYNDAVSTEDAKFEATKADLIEHLSDEYFNASEAVKDYTYALNDELSAKERYTEQQQAEMQALEEEYNRQMKLHESGLILSNGITQLTNGLEIFGTSILNIVDRVPVLNSVFDAAENSIRHFGSTFEGIKDIGSGFATIISQLPIGRNIASVFSNASEEVKTIWQNLLSYIATSFPAVGNVASGLGSIFQGLGKIINTGISYATSSIEGLKKAGHGVASVFSKLGGIASNAFKSIGAGARGAHNPISALVKRIGSMAKTVMIWRVLRSAMNQFRKVTGQAFNEYLKGDAQLKNSIAQLKASAQGVGAQFVTAFAPLINVVVPYLQTLVGWLVTAANAFSAFIAAMTGASTYKQASVAVDAVGSSASGAAGGLNDAADAAKRLREELGDYDELHVVPDDKTDNAGSGGGGGGGGGGAGSGITYTDVSIDDNVSDFAEKVKEAWEKADFTEIGGIIGTKLKEALEMIPWDTIKIYAAKVGASLATLINGFVETSGLGETVGNTIAQLLNTGLTAADSFVSKLNFSSLGKFIADTINGALTGFDWGAAIHFTSTLGTGIANALNEIITPETFGNVGETVGNAVKAAIRGYKNFVDTVDAEGWGKAIASAINNFFDTVSWKDLGLALGNTVIKIFDLFSTAIKETDWSGIAKDIETAISNINWGGIFSSGSKLFGTIIGAVASFISQLAVDAFSGFYDKYIAPQFEGIDMSGNFLQIGGQIILGILKGIGNALLDIGAWIVSNVFVPIIDGIKSAFGIDGSSASGMLDQGKAIMSGFLNGFIETMKNIGDWVKEHIFTPIKDAVGNVGNFFDGAIDTVIEAIFGAAGAIVATVKAGVELVKKGWDTVSGWLNKLGSAIEGAIQAGVSLFKSGWETVSGWLDNLGSVAKGLVKAGVQLAQEGWTTLTGWFNNLGYAAKHIASVFVQLAQEGWTTLTGWFTKLGSAAEHIAEVGVELAKRGWETVVGWVEELGEGAKETVEAFVNLFGDGWNTLQEWLGTIGGAIVNVIANIVKIEDQSLDGKPINVAVSAVLSELSTTGEELTVDNVKAIVKQLWPETSASTIDAIVEATGIENPKDEDVKADVTAKSVDGNGKTANVGIKATSADGNGQTANVGMKATSADGNGKVANVGMKATSADGNGKIAIVPFKASSADGNGQTANVKMKATSADGNGQTANVGMKATKVDGNGQIAVVPFKALSADGNGQTANVGMKATKADGNGQIAVVPFKASSADGNGQIATVKGKLSTLDQNGLSESDKTIKNAKIQVQEVDAGNTKLQIKQITTNKVPSSQKTITKGKLEISEASLAKKNKLNVGTAEISSASMKKGVSITGHYTATSFSVKKGLNASITGKVHVASMTVADWIKKFFKEKGGSFFGGSWHDIPQYAGGGAPSHGTMFVAGENGSEIVGNIGGRTEVLNKSQLASTMYSAVVSAMNASVGGIASKITDYMQVCTNTLIGNISSTNAHLNQISHYTQSIPDAVRLINVNATAAQSQTIDLRGLADAIANKLSGDININNVMQLDGQTVYRDMVQIDRATYRQTGRSGFAY